MKLSKLKLYNYRCFGSEEQIIAIDKLTTFIGNNSAGKTAALSALNTLFSENINDRTLYRSDFHLPKDKEPNELEKQELYIEAVFTFDELQTPTPTDTYAIPVFFNQMVVSEPGGIPYLRIRLEATWEKSASIDGSIESHIFYILCPESEEILDEHRRAAHRRDLDKIRVIYVPAVRDPAKQLRNASGTMMYQIMNSVKWTEETKTNIREKINALNMEFEKEKGVSMFGTSIANQWKAYDSDVRYSTARLRFNSTDIETSIKKTEVVFEPTVTGKEYSIDQMGDGLRSLFYISMVDSVLDVEYQMQEELERDPENTSFNRKPPILTIVALEEPENHIAPHLLGKLVGNLMGIAKKNNAQAIMTSHSPAIVKRIEPEALRHFRLDSDKQTTAVRNLTLPQGEGIEAQYKYIKEAVKAYPELYFAKLVILGEGDSEEIILPKLWATAYEGADVSGISFVPLGGRHVNHFWRLLNDLQIPHITLLDLDRERTGGGWGRIKYALNQLIENGIDRDALLTIDGTTLSADDLEHMLSWDNSDHAAMQKWLDKLEAYHVYFSAPLDIDFMMLESFGSEYKGILDRGEGPIYKKSVNGTNMQVAVRSVEDDATPPSEYFDYLKRAVNITLKTDTADGITYSHSQRKLMAWYNYFFLNRGKPSTHIAALSSINEDVLKNQAPDVLKRLMNDAKTTLEGASNEDNPS